MVHVTLSKHFKHCNNIDLAHSIANIGTPATKIIQVQNVVINYWEGVNPSNHFILSRFSWICSLILGQVSVENSVKPSQDVTNKFKTNLLLAHYAHKFQYHYYFSSYFTKCQIRLLGSSMKGVNSCNRSPNYSGTKIVAMVNGKIFIC